MVRVLLRLIWRILVLLVLAGAALYIYHRAQPAPPAGPPAKAVVPGAQPSKPVGSPEPDFLLRNAHEIGLSPEQVEKLRKQAAGFEKSVSPLRKELDTAGETVARELNRLSNQKVTVPGMQERVRPLSELSAKMAQLREAAWEEEQKILTPEQRRKALDAWAKMHQLIPTRPASGKSETPKSAAPGGAQSAAPGSAQGGGG